MRNIYLIISSISLALLLSACGGGDTADSGSSSTQIPVVHCDTNTTTPIEDGDTLVKETDDTTVTITDTDGDKKVCTDTGDAHLLR